MALANLCYIRNILYGSPSQEDAANAVETAQMLCRTNLMDEHACEIANIFGIAVQQERALQCLEEVMTKVRTDVSADFANQYFICSVFHRY